MYYQGQFSSIMNQIQNIPISLFIFKIGWIEIDYAKTAPRYE